MDRQILTALMDIQNTLAGIASILADFAQGMRGALSDDDNVHGTRPSPAQFEGVARHEMNSDGTNYFRYELPGKRWLLVRAAPDLLVEEVQVEDSSGDRVQYTLERVIEEFGELPMFHLHVRENDDLAEHVTDRSLNRDVAL